MSLSSIIPKRLPNYAVHVFMPGGVKYGVFYSFLGSEAQAIDSVKRKVYKLGRLAHFYRYVVIDLKIQS